ncbi:MAG: hypothetical protein WC640_03975 [Candidatus Paceibacterota bacterium]|jgi:hypothetical protein
MILTPHAVVGAALASGFGFSPGIALVAGFASHFVLDSLPHWDYKLLSHHKDKINPINDDIIINRKFLVDLVKLGLDFVAGISLAWLFFANHGLASNWAIMAGALGGVLPDFLQFVYIKTRIKSLGWVRRWHIYVHGSELEFRFPTTPLIFFLILFSALILGNWFFFIG